MLAVMLRLLDETLYLQKQLTQEALICLKSPVLGLQPM